MSTPYRIAITTGDQDGIGFEVTAKALAKLKPQKGVQFLLWRSPNVPKSLLRRIDSAFTRTTVETWPEALRSIPNNYKEILDIESNLSPARWVETSAKAAMFRHIDAISTAPLSKPCILDAGMNDIGHTDILKRVAKTQNVFMSFIGSEFSVVLVTGHIAIKDISKKITEENLLKACGAADRLRGLLPKKQKDKKIAILGLNPHSGEDGIIGSEEKEIFKKVLQKLKRKKIPFDGPLVPDAAFFPDIRKKYSVYVCNYHDQGLIPFKSLQERNSGVHITMGLPFVRTSVDHGTAKDLFGKNKADPNSMFECIKWAISLCKYKDANLVTEEL